MTDLWCHIQSRIQTMKTKIKNQTMNNVLQSNYFRSRAGSHSCSLIITSRRSSSRSLLADAAVKKFCNRRHHPYFRKHPRRIKYTSFSSQNYNVIRKASPQPSSHRSSNKAKYFILSLSAFFTINAFGTYTHFHDNLFEYYPLPFAIDVGVGPSMMPTLTPNIGELYLRDVWSYRSLFSNTHTEYQRGDVVTMYNPYSQSIVTKRIVGVEGDTIQLFGEYASEFCKRKDDNYGGVPVDGRFNPPFCQTLQQEYLEGAATNIKDYDATMKVPPNHVWIEGDNPLESTDSRHYGPLPISALRGRIVLRLWPMMSSGGFYRLPRERPSPFSKK